MTTRRFYDAIRPLFGGAMGQGQVDGVNLLVAACKDARLNRQSAAYVLATAFHETGATMAPIEENLNYSATGLRATWPRVFHPHGNDGIAEKYARKPEAGFGRRGESLVIERNRGDAVHQLSPGWTRRPTRRTSCFCNWSMTASTAA